MKVLAGIGQVVVVVIFVPLVIWAMWRAEHETGGLVWRWRRFWRRIGR